MQVKDDVHGSWFDGEREFTELLVCVDLDLDLNIGTPKIIKPTMSAIIYVKFVSFLLVYKTHMSLP